MSRRSIFQPSVSVSIGAACALLGCGATGLDWVGEAHLDYSASRSSVATAESTRAPRAAELSAPAEAGYSEGARPRLSRTVTLGEAGVVAPAAQARGAAPAGGGVSVTVNNYNSNQVAPAHGYGGFGYARSSSGFSPSFSAGSAARGSSSGPQPGQNWPAIADHGTSFPYRSAPASPWARTQ